MAPKEGRARQGQSEPMISSELRELISKTLLSANRDQNIDEIVAYLLRKEKDTGTHPSS